MRITLIIVLILIIVFASIVVVNNKIHEVDFAYKVSRSITEAKKHNIFIKEVKVSPDRLLIENHNLDFDECWIEEKVQIKYRFLFFKTINKLGLYRLCLTLKNSSPNISDLYFRREGAKFNFSESSDIYVDDLKSISISKIKVDIMQERDSGDYQKVGQIRLFL